MEEEESTCAEGEEWGPIAKEVSDPLSCIIECRRRFLKALLPRRGTFERICAYFSYNIDEDSQGELVGSRPTIDTEPSHPLHTGGGKESRNRPNGEREDQRKLLWSLYCCDSQLCGVNHLGQRGLDPNTNWLIDSCKALGHSPVEDNGPPPSTYTCPASLSCQAGEVIGISESQVQAYPSPTQMPRLSGTVRSSVSGAVSTPAVSVLMPTHATLTTINKPPGTRPEPTFSDSNTSKGGLTSGSKTVIIAITLSLFGLFCLMLAFCILHRRRLRRNEALPRSASHQELHGHKSDNDDSMRNTLDLVRASSDNPSPVPTSTSREDDALAELLPRPPPRLGERRFLPSFGKSDSGTQNETTILHRTALAATIEPPNFSLKHEKVGFGGNDWKQAGYKHPRTKVSEDGHVERSQVLKMKDDSIKSVPSSMLSSSAYSTFPITKHAATENPIAPMHKAAKTSLSLHFSIPTCLSSPGPPPSKALPQTPSAARRSPRPKLWPSSSSVYFPSFKRTDQAGNVGAGVDPTSSYHPARGVDLLPEARDLYDLTAECAKETGERKSWDFWQSAESEAKPMMLPSVAQERKSPPLKEADLERLAGKY